MSFSPKERRNMAIASLLAKPIGVALLGTPLAPLGGAILVASFSTGVVALTGSAGTGKLSK